MAESRSVWCIRMGKWTSSSADLVVAFLDAARSWPRCRLPPRHSACSANPAATAPEMLRREPWAIESCSS